MTRTRKALSIAGMMVLIGSLFVWALLFGGQIGTNIKDRNDCWVTCHEDCEGRTLRSLIMSASATAPMSS